jgi:hypothetical protein
LKRRHRGAQGNAQSLHDKMGKAKRPSSGRGRKPKPSSGEASLFGDDREEVG